MRRGEFIGLVGGAAAWPRSARAQQSATIRRVVLLAGNSSADSGKYLIDCFVDGLRELGWADGTNLKIDLRWTEGISARYVSFAADLVSSNPDLIVVTST